jgi:hypothetical protein
MSTLWQKVAALAFLTFLGLWIVAIIGGFALPLPRASAHPVPYQALAAREDQGARRQMANNLAQLGLARVPVRGVLDLADIDKVQVHEKIGRVATATADFAADEAALRGALEEHKAGVVHEASVGVAPDRRLVLEVGVSPERFDDLVDRLQGVGRLDSLSVERHDRTGELRLLTARRQSLKKHLEVVKKLSARDNPTTEDSLKVAREMREVERELEVLSTQAGDFLGRESFYTVTVTLAEEAAGRHGRATAVALRAGHAFLWAGAWWCAAVVVAGSLAGAVVSARVLMRPMTRGEPAAAAR